VALLGGAPALDQQDGAIGTLDDGTTADAGLLR
jgi:hypothetical protein